MAFSADGRSLASIAGSEAFLWDMGSGSAAPIRAIDGNIAISPNGRWLVTGNILHRIGDRSAGAVSNKELRGHSSRVIAAAFSPDSRIVATSSYDSTVRLWDVETGSPIKICTGHIHPVVCVGFSPDGRWIASAGDDHTIRIWDLNGVNVRTLQGPTHSIRCIAFSPDGRQIAGAGDDREVWIWKVDNWFHPIANTNLPGEDIGTISPDGRWIARVHKGYVGVQVFETAGAPKQVYSAHTPVGTTAAAFSADSKLLGVSGGNGSVSIWQTDRWNRVSAGIPDRQNMLALGFGPGGRKLFCAGDQGRIWIVDSATGTPLNSYSLPDNRRINALAISPDGSMVAAGCGGDPKAEYKVYILRFTDGHILTVLDQSVFPIDCVAFSPDGKQLAVSGQDWTIRLWNTTTWTQTGVLNGHSYPVSSICFTSDSHYLISGSWDQSIRIWDVEEQRVLVKFPMPFSVRSVSLSSDNTRLVACGGITAPWIMKVPSLAEIKQTRERTQGNETIHNVRNVTSKTIASVRAY
jgi:WD40 repeat protein